MFRTVAEYIPGLTKPLTIVQNDLVMKMYTTLVHGEDIACLPDLVSFVMMEQKTPEFSFC